MDGIKIGGAFAMGLLLYANVASAQCAKDTDCKGSRVCEEGRCVAGSGNTPPPRRHREEAEVEESYSPGVAVNFIGSEREELFVIASAGKTCAAPCTIRLRPGAQQVITTAGGSPSFGSMIIVPENGGTFRLSKGGRPYLGAGIALTAVGFVVGVSFWTIGSACGSSVSCAAANLIAWPIIGSGIFFTGVGLLGYGATHAKQRGAELISDGRLTMAVPRLTSFGITPSRLGSGAVAGVSFAY